MSDQDTYSSYYFEGMRVGVGIPMSNAQIFRDWAWAYIEELDEDLVTLQLSRDQLPVNVRLTVGQILELRGGRDDNGYSCRAIIVSEGYEQELLLRLIGEVVSDELREFYRIDAFLPVKYYITTEQNLGLLEKEWRARRQERIEHDAIKKQKHWDSRRIAGAGSLPHEKHIPHDTLENDDSWDTIFPLAANISGGGIRIGTHQGFEENEFILLEILVPMPRRIIDVVARVIFANPVKTAGEPNGFYNTALQFVFIEEGDRDAIVSHISEVQLKRIRQLRETYLFRDEKIEIPPPVVKTLDFKTIVMRIAIVVILLVLTLTAVNFFRNYSKNRPKNEIEEIFEGGIKRYIEMQKK